MQSETLPEPDLPPWVQALRGLQALAATLPIAAWILMYFNEQWHRGGWSDVELVISFPFLVLIPSLLIILAIVSCSQMVTSLGAIFAIELIKSILATITMGLFTLDGSNAMIWPFDAMFIIAAILCFYPVLYYTFKEWESIWRDSDRGRNTITGALRKEAAAALLLEGGNAHPSVTVDRDLNDPTRRATQQGGLSRNEPVTENTPLIQNIKYRCNLEEDH